MHFKTIVRSQTASGYTIPQDRELRLELHDPQTYDDHLDADGDALADGHGELGLSRFPPTPIWARTTSTFRWGERRYLEGTNFSVEDYKKPEYAVKVTAQTPRVLQGQPIKATIDARYYFGEPVANAKVKWVVHTSNVLADGTRR